MSIVSPHKCEAHACIMKVVSQMQCNISCAMRACKKKKKKKIIIIIVSFWFPFPFLFFRSAVAH